MHRATAALIATVAALALTGCGGGGAEVTPSPLDEYLGAAWGGDLGSPEQQARLQDESERRDDLVAQCMAEAGFEYTPVALPGTTSAAPAEAYDRDSREWVQQYGYGIVTSPGRADPLAPEAQQPAADANRDYVAALSEPEQAAYYAALYGTPDAEGAAEALMPGGCHDWAQTQLDGDNPLTSGEHTELIDAINRFYTELPRVPDLAALNAEWAACMEDTGHGGFVQQRDAETSIAEAVSEYYGKQTSWAPDDPALAELAEQEVALALADLDCREDTDFRPRESAVTAAQEEAFIADHKAELESFKSDAEAAE